MPCAASPPSTFCQEKVVTSTLVQSIAWAKMAEVASAKVSPPRLAGIQSPLGTRTPEVVPFQVNSTSRSKSTLPRSGSLPYSASMHAQVFQLQLLGGVGHPALAEALPGQRVDAACAQHGPHGHLEGAGVGGRHDAADVAGGQAQQRLGLVDGELQARLAFLGAMRAAEERLVERLQGPAGALGAGAGGEQHIARPLGRLGRRGHEPTLSDSCPSLGRGVPARASNQHRLRMSMQRTCSQPRPELVEGRLKAVAAE